MNRTSLLVVSLITLLLLASCVQTSAPSQPTPSRAEPSATNIPTMQQSAYQINEDMRELFEQCINGCKETEDSFKPTCQMECETYKESKEMLQYVILQTQSFKKIERGPCPDLSDIRFSLEGDSPLMGGYLVVLQDYRKPTFHLEYTSPWTVAGGGVAAVCRKGSEKGENVNYIYCDYGIYLISKDNQGKILDKRDIILIFDEQANKYVAAQCD